MTDSAVFELFVRRLPNNRNFLLAAGLEQSIEYLESIRFAPDELAWLEHSGRYRKPLLDYLTDFKFTGDVNAMDEGTPFFPDEPIVQVIAPLPEAQFIESRLINLIHFQTIVASKAARSFLAAPDKLLVDFGMRRAHGAEAALFAARASYIGGYSGTSTVLAGQLFHIPVYGTMAHSFIQAHQSELLAFEHFAKSQIGSVILLIDTYDTERGALKVAQLVPRLQTLGLHVDGVRLDSGDLGQHSKKVRSILNAHGLTNLKIFVSGNLDELLIHRLLDSGAPIDGFGVGTLLTTSADAPYLDCAYKLQQYAGLPRRKRSEGKATWPGPKQVYRNRLGNGSYAYDRITLQAELASGDPLLKPVIRRGQRINPPKPLAAIRQSSLQMIGALPASLRSLQRSRDAYRVDISDCLIDLARDLDRASLAF